MLRSFYIPIMQTELIEVFKNWKRAQMVCTYKPVLQYTKYVEHTMMGDIGCCLQSKITYYRQNLYM